MVIAAEVEHPPASTTFTVYVPPDNPVAESFVPPIGVHEYVKGPTPPVIVTNALPSLPWQVPLTIESLIEYREPQSGGTMATSIISPPQQEFTSEEVTVYVPATFAIVSAEEASIPLPSCKVSNMVAPLNNNLFPGKMPVLYTAVQKIISLGVVVVIIAVS
jgi:hypothetical protein